MRETTRENGALTPQLPPDGVRRTFLLDLPQFQSHIARLANECGGNAALGRRLGLTGQFIDYLISGKRKPGRKALAAFGVRRKLMIEIDVET